MCLPRLDLPRLDRLPQARADTAPSCRTFHLLSTPEPSQELTLEECDTVWFVRFALDFQGRSLAVGTKSGRVLVFDPWALSTAPVARLKPRRPLPKSGARFLVRQTALSYDGSILVACHDDGSITRYDRGCAGAASSQQEPSGAAPLLVRGGSGPVGRL